MTSKQREFLALQARRCGLRYATDTAMAMYGIDRQRAEKEVQVSIAVLRGAKQMTAFIYSD